MSVFVRIVSTCFFKPERLHTSLHLILTFLGLADLFLDKPWYPLTQTLGQTLTFYSHAWHKNPHISSSPSRTDRKQNTFCSPANH